MVMVGYIKVTSEELDNQSNAANSELIKMQSLFDDLNAKITKVSNYWIGEASRVHCESYKKKMQTVTEILARYREHIVDLRTMAGLYSEAEQSAVNLADELPASTL